MSLFGLINMVFGLGALTKEGVSEAFERGQKAEKAYQNGKSYYYVGSKTYSMKTGKRARVCYEHGRTYLRDLYTREIIEDITYTDNMKREAEEKRASLASGCVFYRKAEWDIRGYRCDIWASDVIPGYFYKVHNYDTKQDKFYSCGIEEGKRNGNIVIKRELVSSMPLTVYSPDGTLLYKEKTK